MAFGKSDKTITKDILQQEEMWKAYIRSEDDSGKYWKYNWGWTLEEYEKLRKKLQEKSENSEFLSRVTEQVVEDHRRLKNFPNTTNHEYGWLASQEEFRLENFGRDFFKPLDLPDIYKIVKH